ncbi:MAG: hypothetical protein VZR95_02955, partial [Alphaproteobacteria bacterium]
MTYTRSAIGLLTRQYRSVLKKCFLINMGLFALGAVSAANAAAPKPTLDDMNTKASTFSTTSHYDLATTQGTNTHFLLLDNGSGVLTQYWYTPAEDTAEKNNILNYLAGVALTTEGADEEHYVFKQGTTYYKFDMSKPRPASIYEYTGDTVDTFAFKNNSTDIATFTDGTSSNYDVAVKLNKDTTKYYNIAIDPTKASHMGSKAVWSAITKSEADSYTWANTYVTSSNVTISGDTITGAIRFKTPHNGSVPSVGSWNRYFTYTYTKPAGYDIKSSSEDRLNDTLDDDGDNASNKVFANITQDSGDGGVIYNHSDKSNARIISDFIGNSILSSSSFSSGGVIYNDNKIKSIEGSFVGNILSSTNRSSYGGAIYNQSSSYIHQIKGDFIGNSAVSSASTSNYYSSYGGAIYNNGTIDSIEGNFIGNSARAIGSTSGSYGYTYAEGAAISNYNGKINKIKGNFIGNSAISSGAFAYGGAISNYGSFGTAIINSIVGDFIGNSVTGAGGSDYGGAISNRVNDNYLEYSSAYIGSITGDFIGNHGGTAYGAIYNGKNSMIGSITGDFIGNSVKRFGAGFTNYGTINSVEGNFIGNRGGAIQTIGNISSIVGNFIGNVAVESYGAAIVFSGGNIGTIKGDFIDNSIQVSSTSWSRGGAIDATGTSNSIEGNFIGNNIRTTSNGSGGAISAYGATLSSIKGEFIGNYVKTTSGTSLVKGGAIIVGLSSKYNARSEITLSGNTFTGNYIDNNGVITPNSIFNAGKINIANGATVTINDGYDSFNDSTNSGKLNVGTGSIFNLSVDNGVLQTDNLGTVTNNGTMTWDLDVQFNGASEAQSDKITLTSLSGTQSIIINAINLMVEPTDIYTVNVATGGSALANALTIAAEDGILKTRGATQWWDVTYTSADGLLHFAPGEAPVLDTLVSWIAKDEADKAYTIASGGEIVAENLGTLVNNKLTVSGNGETTTNKVIGGNFAGVSLGATAQTLELEDIAEWSGFTGNAVNNGTSGTVKVKNVNFSNNATADIANAGTLEFTGTNSLSKITGDGAMEVKSGTTTVASLAQGTLTVTSGELVNNGAATIGGGSNAGTISGTGSLANSGAFENKSGATISQAVSHSGTGTNAFTNNGTISGAVTNSGVFANNSSIS